MKVVKEFKFQNFTIKVEKLKKPLYGGFYQVSSFCNNDHINTLNGYGLDAAIEVFNLAKQNIIKQHIPTQKA